MKLIELYMEPIDAGFCVDRVVTVTKCNYLDLSNLASVQHDDDQLAVDKIISSETMLSLSDERRGETQEKAD